MTPMRASFLVTAIIGISALMSSCTDRSSEPSLDKQSNSARVGVVDTMSDVDIAAAGTAPSTAEEFQTGGAGPALPPEMLLPSSHPGPELPEPMRVGGDVKAPRIIKRIDPQYDHCTRQSGLRITAIPIVEAIVEKDGTIRSVRIVKSAEPCIDRAFVEAVKRWQFAPATYRGEPVPSVFNLTLTIHFR
jgi:TonB family protein